MLKSQTEYKLKNPPDDAISTVRFGPNTNQFVLVSSWDCNVRLYDILSNTLRHKYSHDAPVLDCCFTVCLPTFTVQILLVQDASNFRTLCTLLVEDSTILSNRLISTLPLVSWKGDIKFSPFI